MTPNDLGETALIGFLVLAAIRETRDAIMLISGRWRISTPAKPKPPKPAEATVPLGEMLAPAVAEQPAAKTALRAERRTA